MWLGQPSGGLGVASVTEHAWEQYINVYFDNYSYIYSSKKYAI